TTPIASAGGSYSNVLADFDALLGGVTTYAGSRLFYVASPGTLKALKFLTSNQGVGVLDTLQAGGELLPITVMASDAIPAGTALLFDATEISGNSDPNILASSQQALLQLSTTPDSPPVATTTTVSLWQQDLVALRAERFFGFALHRTNGAASLSGIAY